MIFKRNTRFDAPKFSRYFKNQNSRDPQQTSQYKSDKVVPLLPMLPPTCPDRLGQRIEGIEKVPKKFVKKQRKLSENNYKPNMNLDEYITEELKRQSPNISYGRIFNCISRSSLKTTSPSIKISSEIKKPLKTAEINARELIGNTYMTPLKQRIPKLPPRRLSQDRPHWSGVSNFV
mmetsp:Transcript_32736/g.32091  ORF Transcript_32736/g.32091 Transcript_32736/m.32091 type:complete len:176 (+) Transcript_32736:749-1276(+)